MTNWDKHLAARVWDVRGSREDSPFIRLLALTKGKDQLISLGRGDPDLPTPAHVVDAAIAALRAGKTKYTVPAGLIELRTAVARKLRDENALDYDPEREIVITAGTQEAVNVVLQALIAPGDEVILPDPYYMAYFQAIRASGGVAAIVRTTLEDNFVVRPEAIEAAITERTKAIILVSPSNPTGTVIDPATARAVAEIAIRHDLVVISDELYEHVVFDGAKVTSIAALPGMWERTITVNGFSKAFNMTGLRVGYFAGPAAFVGAALELRHMLSICAPSVSQYAALAALEGPYDALHEALATYKERRDLMLGSLREQGVPCNRPEGAFFVFADIRATGLGAFDFCVRLLEEEQVQVFPGTQYGAGGEGFVRISFLTPKDQLAVALERFGRFYHRRSA
jgi:aminotransferase